MDFQEQSTILVTCGPGLSDYLQQEIEALGYSIDSVHKGGIETKGTRKDAMFLNIHLRTAYNVLFLLKKFTAENPNQLYKRIYSMPWHEMIDPEESLSVVSRITTDAVDNSMFASVKVKDAIVDKVTEKMGTRPDSGREKDNLVYHLYWRDDQCWLYLNTSGLKLSDRSYRKIPHSAPMRETLAAGVLMATGYDGTKPLLVPMCGSGTIAIEAALIAASRPCGLLRSNFGFMHEKGFDSETWQELRREAAKTKKTTPAKIIATDIDPVAVASAKKNALTAGVDHLIDFEVCDFAGTTVPEEPGLIVLNPEYGYRIGEIKELEKTYSRIGDFFKQKCPGYTGYIFTGNMELGKKVGLKASRRFIFFNGDIDCRLLKYEMYRGTKRKPKPAESVKRPI